MEPPGKRRAGKAPATAAENPAVKCVSRPGTPAQRVSRQLDGPIDAIASSSASGIGASRACGHCQERPLRCPFTRGTPDR